MCLSALGDMVSKAESKVAHSEAPDRATLCSAVESLTGVVQKTQPKQNTTRTADVGLLGAGLMTSSQLMDSQYGNRDMRKGLQQKAQQLQDVLISQSHEYLASQLPDSPGKDASQGALDQSASSLLVVRALNQCAYHTVRHTYVSSVLRTKRTWKAEFLSNPG